MPPRWLGSHLQYEFKIMSWYNKAINFTVPIFNPKLHIVSNAINCICLWIYCLHSTWALVDLHPKCNHLSSNEIMSDTHIVQHGYKTMWISQSLYKHQTSQCLMTWLKIAYKSAINKVGVVEEEVSTMVLIGATKGGTLLMIATAMEFWKAMHK